MDTSNFKEVFTSDEVKQLRQRVAELEQHLEARYYYNGNRGFKDLQTIEALTAERDEWKQIAEGRCDALIKQRDELLAALINHQEQTRPIQQTIDAIASVKEKE